MLGCLTIDKPEKNPKEVEDSKKPDDLEISESVKEKGKDPTAKIGLIIVVLFLIEYFHYKQKSAF